MSRSDTPAPAGRLPSLTGMRFAAALLVFCFHASYENVFADRRVNGAFREGASQAGWTGVSFFFVLSGFVLAFSARRHDTWRAFWRRRLWKVYPSHLLTAAAAVALLAAAGLPRPGLLRNLLLVQTWQPDVDVILGANPVSWSLSCEALFYLAFPALWAGVRRIRPGRLWWWAAALAAVVALLPAAAGLLLPGGPHMYWLAISEEQYWFLLAFPPVRAAEFVLGMVMARLVAAGRFPATGLWPAALALALAYTAALALPVAYGIAALGVAPLAWLVAAGATADLRGSPGVFAARPVVWLGQVSFAFYLLHRLVQFHGHRALGEHRAWSTPAAAALLLLAAALTLLLAWAMHTAVEQPLLRRFSARRPRRPAPGPPAPGPPVPGPPAPGPPVPGLPAPGLPGPAGPSLPSASEEVPR
ncbi:acyltransferase family protein [Streptomyces sp. NRRL B-1347]|uniref:acyltransferase family protein n=1 Tax=Streptomyces sp. NRRL B-1347 TaxID=1476877 RepID=UPI0006891F2B|nr:acyltransferase [Streptomyces sp. NRRL B-1347]